MNIMIKNNRPYSVENGSIDDALITDRSIEDIDMVMRWIKDNIRPSDKVLYGRTSYGLKHILEHDTKIYLTNNEFKDAMMFAGYLPVDENELNWRYHILLVKEINDNPSPFFKWVIKEYEGKNSPQGDFASDMAGDFRFPMIAHYGVIKRYLNHIGACDGAMRAFEELWSAYCLIWKKK